MSINNNHHNYSKEAINSRMLQNATRLWGVKSVQMLDPFVKLLIDAFSTEVFKTNNEIQSVHGRILEKLAKLLTPSKYSHPNPAHAIAFSMPHEDREILMEHTEFFLKKQMNSFLKNESDRQIEMAFTPVDNIELIKAQTGLIIVGNTVYAIDEQLNKIPVTRFHADPENYRKIKIGIDITNYTSEVFPESITLYCANPAFQNVEFVYELLPHISVTHNGISLSISQGLQVYHSQEKEGYENIFKEQSIEEKIKRDISNVYNHQFLHITGISPNMYKGIELGLPKGLDDGSDVWEDYRYKKYLWLELEFPPQFTGEILENFLFVLNAFPVYNRVWKKTEYALDIMGNNIPLKTESYEFFLYVDEVIDEQGKTYHEIPFTPTDHLGKGLYTVRKGGMERFTSRNATDLMAHIMELLRDEVAAFSLINRDKVKEVLGEISEKMKGMMKKVGIANRELQEEVNYVIIEPLDDAAHTYATFWVSHCSLANNIRPGTEFFSQKRVQKIMMLTETTGGAEEQKHSDIVQAYKYALTTRDQIITVEDIKNYCRMVLKNRIKTIQVKRGTMISNKPKEGFIRTVDINIVPVDYELYGTKYWNNMEKVLKNSIKSKAIDGVEYRVKISYTA